MTRTTRPPDRNVVEGIPSLSGRQRATVRLHPRLGPEPPDDASKMGGRMRWPADEPWPTCDQPHAVFDLDAAERFFVQPPDGRPYAPVIQLRSDDVPELGFPPGADTFQLLWCPASHPDLLYAPAIDARWLAQANLAAIDPPPPMPSPDGAVYVPRPCVLHPEHGVVEYPSAFDLDEATMVAVSAWEDTFATDPAYQYRLSTAPGTKVGGWPHWYQDPQWPACTAGHPMEHLLTISDVEFDGGSWPRWEAIEDGDVWDGPVQARFDAQSAAGLDLGMGSIYVFICRTCPGWPIAQVYQR